MRTPVVKLRCLSSSSYACTPQLRGRWDNMIIFGYIDRLFLYHLVCVQFILRLLMFGIRNGPGFYRLMVSVVLVYELATTINISCVSLISLWLIPSEQAVVCLPNLGICKSYLSLSPCFWALYHVFNDIRILRRCLAT